MDNKIMTRRIGIIFILLVSLFTFFFGISTAKAADKLDVRFIIDSSTTMKSADPDNFRIRALQKLIRSLPNDARSGVWTYGKYVNMLVPIGITDAKWKKQAVYNIDKINAFGTSSNLAGALQAASHGWQDKAGYKKHIIVVTNSKNMEERAILLNKTLPKLKAAGIKLQTISLTNSNSIDNRFLKLLALQTHGKWYQVSNAKFIDKVMNHAYQQVKKQPVA